MNVEIKIQVSRNKQCLVSKNGPIFHRFGTILVTKQCLSVVFSPIDCTTWYHGAVVLCLRFKSYNAAVADSTIVLYDEI